MNLPNGNEMELTDSIWLVLMQWSDAQLEIARIDIGMETAQAEEKRLREEHRTSSRGPYGQSDSAFQRWQGWLSAMRGSTHMALYGIPVRFVASDEPFRLIPPRNPLVFGASA